MSVDIAGIMTNIVLAGVAYGLVNAGGAKIHDAVSAIKEKRYTTLKKRYSRSENAGNYWACVLGALMFGLFLCFIAGAIAYMLIFVPGASTLL